MYASITGLEKYTNQVWRSPYFAWVSTFSLKPADFPEIRFIILREKTCVVIINLGDTVDACWSININ